MQGCARVCVLCGKRRYCRHLVRQTARWRMHILYIFSHITLWSVEYSRSTCFCAILPAILCTAIRPNRHFCLRLSRICFAKHSRNNFLSAPVPVFKLNACAIDTFLVCLALLQMISTSCTRSVEYIWLASKFAFSLILFTFSYSSAALKM